MPRMNRGGLLGVRRPEDGTGAARFARHDEIARWDELIAENPDGGSPWRSHAYAESMRAQGCTPLYVLVGDLACTVIQVQAPLLGPYWYVPGPGVDSVEDVARVTHELTAFAAENGIFTVRVAAVLTDSAPARAHLVGEGFRRTLSWSTDHTILVDLTGSEQEVLGRFSTRTRRWIKRAARDNVVIERVDTTDDNLQIIYGLLMATADKRFSIPDGTTATDMFRLLQSSGNGQLFLARHDGAVVAGAFATRLGAKALYLSGASVRREAGKPEGNGLGAHGVGHAVQWEIIRWAREHGATEYDMYGSPSTAAIDDPSHPLYGVGQFKLSFNKEITDYVGCYDAPVHRGRSWLMYQSERLSVIVHRWKITGRIAPHLTLANPDLDWLR